MKNYFKNLDNRWAGIAISILSVIILLILASLSIKIAKSDAVACVHPGGGQCPLGAHVPLASYIGAAFLIALFILGIKLALKLGASEKLRKEIADKTEVVVKTLKGNEKNAYEIVMASQGAIFQSELVEKMGRSKVEVSRILDRLEGKNLIERRRRGLTNMVLIKYR